jgi:hypothetical protein
VSAFAVLPFLFEETDREQTAHEERVPTRTTLVRFLLQSATGEHGANPRAAHAVAVPYLKLWGLVAGGWQLGRGVLAAARKLAAQEGDEKFLAAKITTARFYAESLLPQAASLARAVTGAGESALRLPAEQF